MSFVSRDGRRFASTQQLRKYEASQDELGKAPGGTNWDAALRDHGNVRKIIIEREGNGRHRVTSTHADGFTATSVHPEAFRAHEVAKTLLGLDEPPPAIKTQVRARQTETGPKEEKRQEAELGAIDKE